MESSDIKFNSENEIIDYVKSKIAEDIQYSFRNYENFFKAALSYYLANHDEYCFPTIATERLLKMIEKQKNFKIRFNKQEFVGFVGDFYKTQLFSFENEAQIDSKLRRLAKIVNESNFKGSIYPWVVIFSMAMFRLRAERDKIKGNVLPDNIITDISTWIYKKLRDAGFPRDIQFASLIMPIGNFVNVGGFKVKRGGPRPRNVKGKTPRRTPVGNFSGRKLAKHVAAMVRQKGLAFGTKVKPRIR